MGLPAQIRCGDLYNDKAVEAFTACAVSDKKCVPQRVDADAFRVPGEDVLDESFDLNNFQVRQSASCALFLLEVFVALVWHALGLCEAAGCLI